MEFKIVIKFDTLTNKVELSGPTDDPVLALGMIESAKAIIINGMKMQVIYPFNAEVKK